MAKIDFDLLIEYFSGHAGPAEAERVEDFAQSSPEALAYFQQLYLEWLKAGDENYQKPDVEKEWLNFQRQHFSKLRKRTPTKILGIAVTLLVLMGLGVYFSFFYQHKPMLTTLSATRQEIKILPDSSAVTLYTGTELQYPLAFSKDERIVRLKHGMALFQIRHHAKWPFIVQLRDSLYIRVTGTEFLVTENTKSLKVHLLQGRILFYNRTDTLFLKPGQTAEYFPEKKKMMLTLPLPKTGSFNFNDATMSRVIAELQNYFHCQIRLEDPSIAHCRLTARFKNQNLKTIIQIISATFGFNAKMDGQKILLDGKGCR